MFALTAARAARQTVYTGWVGNEGCSVGRVFQADHTALTPADEPMRKAVYGERVVAKRGLCAQGPGGQVKARRAGCVWRVLTRVRRPIRAHRDEGPQHAECQQQGREKGGLCVDS